MPRFEVESMRAFSHIRARLPAVIAEKISLALEFKIMQFYKEATEI